MKDSHRRGQSSPDRPGPTVCRLQTRSVSRVCLCALLILGGIGATAAPETRTTSEYELKAAFIYNFLKFTDWPPGAIDENSITIGVIGLDAHIDVIRKALDGRTLRQMTIAVEDYQGPKDVHSRYILYVGEPRNTTIEALLRSVQDRAVLTVGESKDFIPAGGIVRFFEQGSRVRFEINPEAAERAGLQMSSRLLKVATIVRP